MKPPKKNEAFHKNLALPKEERKIPSLGVAARLARHESQIDSHLKSIDTSFFEIGKELAEIRDENDFAEDTFEEYVRNRWKKTRQWGYQMIEGYQTKAGLPSNVRNFLQNQGQTLALGKAPKEEQVKIIKEVAKEGKVTAKKITEKIKEKSAPTEAGFRVIIRDSKGNEIPKSLETKWQSYQAEGSDVRQWVTGIRAIYKKDSPFGVIPEKLNKFLSDLVASTTLEVKDGKIISSHKW